MKSNYYSLAFLSCEGQARSVIIRSNETCITRRLIAQARHDLDMPEDAALLSAVHLGRMNEDHYEGIEKKSRFALRKTLIGLALLWTALAGVTVYFLL